MRRFRTPRRRKYFLKAWWKASLVTGGVVLFMALFVLRFFFIQGRSMESTLLQGDFVYMDKLGYGARIPPHPIAVPYSKDYYLSSVELPYIRMPGLSGIEHNDVIAFDHPIGPRQLPKDKRNVLMKRCVGLPGDSLAILGGKVEVNGERLERPPGVLVHYHFKARTDSSADAILDEIGVREATRLSNQGDRVVPLTAEEAERLEQRSDVTFVEAWQGEEGSSAGFFPEHPDHPWRPGRVGPLWIPEQGASVELDTSSLPLYRRIIEVYEDHELSVEGSEIRIDGELVESYSFEMDYFYVLGDSRPNSRDSRIWGFLPEDHVIGRTLFILFSYDDGPDGEGFRWERTLKGVE